MTSRERPPLQQRGFTLAELILVIVIAGILSAVAYNKMDVSSFKAEGTTDQVKAAVRYAHKLAVAQRRNVYVSAVSNDVKLCYDDACTSPLVEPPGTDSFHVTVSSGVALAPEAFYFDSLGRPTVTSSTALATSAFTLTFTGGSRTITIEPQTGLVH